MPCSRRLVLDAVLYLVRGDMAWAQPAARLPDCCGRHHTYRRSTKSGAWQRIHDVVRDCARVRAGRTVARSCGDRLSDRARS
ncbi:hypothetical protein D5S18_03690 [Nocardia panacis]|uniref:Transposase n=1 Tax=Nocardia panacis TaxID=2340916 RepID=A0A3A4KB37_9NOCA|nr:hypothetical protein D5S18_03690 [Nocardia panacis]